MCGIVGIISRGSFGFYQSQAQLLKGMLYADTLRGADSTGVFGVTKNGNVSILKSVLPGYEFVQTKEFDKFMSAMTRHYLVAIGHNRKATRGDIKPENAHPFKEEHITLVHNGVIWGEEQSGYEVDSHALTARIAKEGAVEALRDIRGAYAIVWYDKLKQQISFARNFQRPLWILEGKDIWILSSEPGIPLWLCQREKSSNNTWDPLEIKAFKEITPNAIYTFDLKESSRDKPRVTPIPEPKPFLAQKKDEKDGAAGSGTKQEQVLQPALLVDKTKGSQIADTGKGWSDGGRYKLLDSYGEFKKGGKVIIKPIDWNDIEEAPKFVRIISEIMCLDGTPFPDFTTHLMISKDELEYYTANKKFEHYRAEIAVIKVPSEKFHRPEVKQDVVLQLRSEWQYKPIGIECKLSRNTVFIQKPLFDQSTITGCRGCQTFLKWENVPDYDATRDVTGKYRFYCAKCVKPHEEPVAGAEGG